MFSNPLDRRYDFLEFGDNIKEFRLVLGYKRNQPMLNVYERNAGQLFKFIDPDFTFALGSVQSGYSDQQEQ